MTVCLASWTGALPAGCDGATDPRGASGGADMSQIVNRVRTAAVLIDWRDAGRPTQKEETRGGCHSALVPPPPPPCDVLQRPSSQSVSQRFPMLKNESERHGAARGKTDIVGTARIWALRISLPDGAASRWALVL